MSDRGDRNPASRGRRRWLGVLVGMLAILIVAEVGARVLEPRLPEPSDWFSPEAARLAREMDHARATGVRSDLLITGSSQAGRDLVPEVLAEARRGEVVHNISIAKGGQALVMDRWLLEEAVPRLQPKSVVWGISSLDFNPARRKESIGRYDAVRATRTGPFGEADRALARTSALARNRAALRDPMVTLHAISGSDLSDALPDRAPPRALTFASGRTRSLTGASRDRVFAQEPAQTRNGPLRDFRVGNREVTTFRHTLRSLREQGIDVHVVIMPVHPGYIAAHPRGAADYDEWRRTVTRAARAEGVPIGDHTHDVPDDGFLDFEHLNPESARTFSRTIAAGLEQGSR